MAKKIFRPYYATATDARIVQTRESLRQALLDLLDQKSLEQITIRDITATAGIGYTTFFRHHQSKEDLLNEVAADEITRLINLALPIYNASSVGEVSLALCTYVDQHRSLWSILLTGGAAGAMREEFIRVSLQVAAEWERPPGADWLPSEVGVILVASATIELLAWWLRQAKPVPAEQVATIFERMIIAPTMNAK